MVEEALTISDISPEMLDTADKYLKKVMINRKRRYYRVLRKLEINGITMLELEKYESILPFEEQGFQNADSECFYVGEDVFKLERSELTEALQELTTLQSEILLKSVLLEMSQEELAAEYAISVRMVRKHKNAAIKKMRRRLSFEA